jgi:PAS domain S-box-containing protein
LPIQTIGERQKALIGFVGETFLYDELFTNVFSGINHEGIAIHVFDQGQLVFDSIPSTKHTADGTHTENSESISKRSISIGDRKWEIEFFVDPHVSVGGVEKYFPNVVLIIGIFVSMLLFAITFTLSSSQERASDLAQKMTRELRDKNQFIEEVLSNLPIGIAVNNIKNGATIYINKAFEAICGWDKKYLTSVQEFFKQVYPNPQYREQIRSLVVNGIASQNPDKMHWDDVKITTESGEVRFVSARNIPLPEQNLMVSTVVDTTSRKISEEEINKKNEELEGVNKLMIGRELKMVELKNEIGKLKEELTTLRKPL